MSERDAMPAKIKGRPNEERKVNELLNKLKAPKEARKKPSEGHGCGGPARDGGYRWAGANAALPLALNGLLLLAALS